MFTVDSYTPTRIVFGARRLQELAEMSLPGSKALICTTKGQSPAKKALQDKVSSLLAKNDIESILYAELEANPTKKSIMAGAQTAKDNACDFVIGLGGGSSIDSAKAIASMMINPGDLWDYAYTGTGGQKDIIEAAPVVAITTTCGTGTETDPYFVITNENTAEKLDFTVEAGFPAVSIIDPELMLSLPRDLTIYQGLDALFHAAECYVTNGHENRLLDMYAAESVRTVATFLPGVVSDPDDLEARTQLAFAADILSGFTQALVSTTSHHILAQTIGGFYPTFPHGATLITVALAYYTKVCGYLPDEFDELAEIMGQAQDLENPGFAFVTALKNLMSAVGCDKLKLRDFGVERKDLPSIGKRTVEEVGIEMDRYTLSVEDMVKILEASY